MEVGIAAIKKGGMESSIPIDIGKKASQLLIQRRIFHKKILEDAKNSSDKKARCSGGYIEGRDENGQSAQTFPPHKLGIHVYGWIVEIDFKRQDNHLLEGLDWKKMESIVKQGAVPAKTSTQSNHIIISLRQLKHIRNGYPAEKKNTDELLAALDRVNLDLAYAKGEIEDSQIDSAIKTLADAALEVSRKTSCLKKKVALQKIKKTILKLHEAKLLPENNRKFAVGAACAIFTAARERIGTWRDKEIAWLHLRTTQRENALRIERDSWLLSQLEWLSLHQNCKSMSTYVFFDQKRLETIFEMGEMLRQKKPDAAAILRVAEKNQKHFLKFIKSYPTFLGYLRAGEPKKALQSLHSIEKFLKSNKPRFIYEELSKSPDPYLKGTLSLFGQALVEFEYRHFLQAAELFAASKKALEGAAKGASAAK
jgi:hypothetical protein